MEAESSINPGLQYPREFMGTTAGFFRKPEKGNQLIRVCYSCTVSWSAREAHSLTSLTHPFPLGEQLYLSVCYQYFMDRAP